MDSMRSLNTSLPRTSPGKREQQYQTQSQQPQQPEDLLSAFKAAALSVTTLYKSAASLQAPARAAGYQDALTDLLTFLDSENLGLGDGEGWSVRQWATERLDGGHLRPESDEEDDDGADDETPAASHADAERKARDGDDLSSSVELPSGDADSKEQDSQAKTSSKQQIRLQSPQQQQPQPHSSSQQMPLTSQPVPAFKYNTAFTFRSEHDYPTNHERDVNMGGQTERAQTPAGSVPASTVVRADQAARPSRGRLYRSNHQRTSNTLRNALGSGAGSKRKFPLGDFFDLSGINFDYKDSSDRGGKRGRHA